MSTTTLVILVAAVVLAAVVALVLIRKRNTRTLQSRFGPEYDRAIEERGGAAKAEADLMSRQRRVARYDLKPLSPQEQQAFTAEWRRIQGQFVDAPAQATRAADDLVSRVMTARGYPEGDFDRRLADLSVDHGQTVQEYRFARETVAAHERGKAGTEEMRQALVHLRALFAELVGEPALVKQAS